MSLKVSVNIFVCYFTSNLFIQAKHVVLKNVVDLTGAKVCYNTRSVNKVMRLIQYNSVLTFKLQIEFVPFKIVPLRGYTPPETLFPLFVAMLVVANRNCF